MTQLSEMSTWRAASVVAMILVNSLACSANSDDSDLFNSTGGQAGNGDGGSGGTTWNTGGSGGETEGGIISERVTLSGRVMAPSGAFPVSGALVYLTQTEPEPIPSGVYHYECDEMQGTPYALSKADGTWTIDAPPGTWKLVTRKGNFRRIRPIEITADMDPNVHEALTTLPGASTQDNQDTTPSFAVVKTSPDLTYNLLAKFGMGQVNASGELVTGTEAFHIYEDSGFSSYAHTSALFDGNNLHNYHMIFLPCYASSVGVAFVKDNIQKLRDYVSAGGRIYNSCTVSLWTEAPFPEYIGFYGSESPSTFDIGRRTNTAYATKGTLLDQGLADWMSVVTANDPNNVPFQNGYVTIDAVHEVDDGHGLEKDGFVVKPYTWVRDNATYAGSPLMVTYNFDQGKVFYSVYETSSKTTAITPQEYVLLYVILEVGVCTNLPPEVK